jgi:hypothetical protein
LPGLARADLRLISTLLCGTNELKPDAKKEWGMIPEMEAA